jgi:hypothetical protein
MSHLTGKPRLFDQGCERPASIVVVGAREIDDSLALHIGLPGEDENLCHDKPSTVAIIDIWSVWSTYFDLNSRLSTTA